MSAIESTVSVKTQTTPLSLKQNKLVNQALIINVLIFVLILISSYTTLPAIIGGISIILYLSARALISPVKTFLLIFGIKLTFDALWFLKLPFPELETYRLLDLFLIPVFVLILLGPKLAKHGFRWPIWFSFIYLIWVILSMGLNGINPDIEIIIRQSGILIGLLIGLRYIKGKEQFDLFLYLIFISTIIPVFASLIQLVAIQLDVVLFYYKSDPTMVFRASGLYYDAGTTGMVNIMSMLSNVYLLQTGIVKSKYRKYHTLFIPLNILAIISGGTRSMIGVALVIIIILFLKYMKQTIKILFFVLIVIVFFSKPYIDPIVSKSAKDIKRNVEITELLSETEYRTMFTGRVGMWQDIWQEFNESTFLQKLFGTGLSSNAHSSYFFLLLQIGWLGLLLYLVLNISLILALWRGRIPKFQKIIAMLSLQAVLLIGISLSTVVYTSFQWFIYIVVGGVLNMRATEKYTERKYVFKY
jgi:O-antigen ligase